MLGNVQQLVLFSASQVCSSEVGVGARTWHRKLCAGASSLKLSDYTIVVAASWFLLVAYLLTKGLAWFRVPVNSLGRPNHLECMILSFLQNPSCPQCNLEGFGWVGRPQSCPRGRSVGDVAQIESMRVSPAALLTNPSILVIHGDAKPCAIRQMVEATHS